MRWLKNVEWLLMAFGALMICTYVVARTYGFVLSQAEVESFKGQRLVAQEGKSGPSTGIAPDFSRWSTERIRAYQESLASHFQPAVAVLRIPKIRLEVPVLEGTGDLVLNRAVGHIEGTALPGETGNVGIAGHRDGFFRGLKDVVVGDRIEVLTRSETNVYVIDQIKIVDVKDVSVLLPRSRSSVTLVTCYPFYLVGEARERYIVQASRIDPAAKGNGETNESGL
jgi:sortase A